MCFGDDIVNAGEVVVVGSIGSKEGVDAVGYESDGEEGEGCKEDEVCFSPS